MKANELRIGNWVNTGDFHIEKLKGNYRYDPSWYQYVGMFSPIPITPEIMGKLPFDKIDNIEYRKGRITFTLVEVQDGYYMNVFFDGSLMCILNYLHQLQNLYFSLTGEELNIEL